MSEHLFGDAKATARTVKRTGVGSALDEARAAYEQNGGDPEVVRAYAELLNLTNRLEEAYKIYKEYLDLTSADQETYFEVGLLAKSLDDHDEAIRLFTKVVEMAPGSPLARSAEYEMWALNGGKTTRWSKQ